MSSNLLAEDVRGWLALVAVAWAVGDMACFQWMAYASAAVSICTWCWREAFVVRGAIVKFGPLARAVRAGLGMSMLPMMVILSEGLSFGGRLAFFLPRVESFGEILSNSV